MIENESASGPFWPVFMEWRSNGWPDGDVLQTGNALIDEIAANRISIFDAAQLPSVFDDFEEKDFGSVAHAIEARTSQYDDDDEDEEEEEEEEAETWPNF